MGKKLTEETKRRRNGKRQDYRTVKFAAFRHIREHQGDERNELADELTRIGRDAQAERIAIPTPTDALTPSSRSLWCILKLTPLAKKKECQAGLFWMEQDFPRLGDFLANQNDTRRRKDWKSMPMPLSE
jgi:hypothetical protein